MKPIARKRSMNKTEKAYADRLEILKRLGEIVDYKFEAVRFRIGEGAYYKPDFLVVYADRFEIHETKGHWREAAKVRIRACAELYPWFNWVAVYYERGKWRCEDF